MNKQEIGATILQMIQQEPFFGHLLTSMNKTITKGVDTMAVGWNPTTCGIELYINESFWDTVLKGANRQQTDRLRFGLMKHEILHVVYKHIFRYKGFSNKDLYGIAVDLVVNQYVACNDKSVKYEELPTNGVFLSTFPEFNLEPHKTVEYYYSTLLKEKEQLPNQGKGEKSEEGESGDEAGEGSSNESDEQPNQSNSNLNQAQKNLQNLLGKDEHKIWGDVDKLDPEMRKFVEERIDDLLEQHIRKQKESSKTWSNLPGNFRDYLEEFLESRVPAVNWRRELRRFTGFAERRFNKPSMKKESRRYGTNPGIRHKRRLRLLVPIDTSGSVGADALALFFAELYHIFKAGAEITVIECDTHIAKEWQYKGKTPVTITGRGGTDFTAPMIYANERDFDAIVYFTDGFGPCPEVKPRAKTMWMICPNGCDVADISEFPGRKIKMPDVELKASK